MNRDDRSWARWEGKALVLNVRAQPRSSRDAFGEIMDDAIKIHTTATPVEGAANTQLVAFLAKQFGVAKRDVVLSHGNKGRIKTFRIESPARFPTEFELPARTSA